MKNRCQRLQGQIGLLATVLLSWCRVQHQVLSHGVLLQKLDAFEGDDCRRLLNVAPYRGSGAQVTQRKPEAFDCKPSVVVQVLQRAKHIRPLNMPASGDATIVLAGMDMLEVWAYRAITRCDVFLFYVCVKGVEQNPNPGMVGLCS